MMDNDERRRRARETAARIRTSDRAVMAAREDRRPLAGDARRGEIAPLPRVATLVLRRPGRVLCLDLGV